MLNKELLKEVATEQKEGLTKIETGVPREALGQIKNYFRLPHVIVVAGIRRSGKSTLLCQLMPLLSNSWYYFNFEDERLIDFEPADFNRLYEVFVELFGEKKIFLFDEIQNVLGWERFVRRMSDEGFKFFITGSNASLLSKELGTKLTGRHIAYNLYPFSFREYLLLHNYKFSKEDLYQTKKRGAIKKYFNDYLLEGGMPEYLKYKTPETIKKVYDDILYRDIVARHDIKDIKSLRELSFYLLSNLGSLFSYNRLKNLLALGSVNTVKNYTEYLENSFLFFAVNLYTYSLKKQLVSPRKVYCIDNGLANAIAFKFSENKGRFLENLVFLELKRRGQEIYYYKTQAGREVDFFCRNNRGDQALIQVAWSVQDKAVSEREIEALLQAMDELKLKKALILTDNEEDIITIRKRILTIKPAYKWLLEEHK